ncbi:MAG: hypothetical protein AAFV29_22890, partial [Myxococcota bacterium]
LQNQALASLADAVAQTARRNICIAGRTPIAIRNTLVIRTGVSISGAYGYDGRRISPGNSVIQLEGAGQLRFVNGADGALRNLTVRRQGGSRAMVVVRHAHPRFLGVHLRGEDMVSTAAMRLESADRATSATLLDVAIEHVGEPNNITGIAVTGEDASHLRVNARSDINIRNCRGQCRGIRLDGAVTASISDASINVEARGAGSAAVAVDLVGSEQAQPSAHIYRNRGLTVRTMAPSAAAQTVAIRMRHAQRVRITDNTTIGIVAPQNGARLSAGIADGNIRRDGTLVPGQSVSVEVSGNRQIIAGQTRRAWPTVGCPSSLVEREGADVAAGVLFVGTMSATVANNGHNRNRDAGIFGGASAAWWTSDNGRTLAPSVPAIWTLATRDVTIRANELRAGVLV